MGCCVLCCVPCEMFCYVFRPACSDHFTDTRHTFEELLQGLNSWSIGPLTRNKLQNTEYVDNDVDVDDVDDDEEGAGAYFFFWSDTAMVIPTVNYIEWSA